MEIIDEIVQLAKTTALEAGQLVAQLRQMPVASRDKGFRDVVTEADFASQKLIKDRVLAQFPDHAFFAEEEDGDLIRHSNVVWMIDPVDGTSNYSRLLPIYAISIGVAINGVVQVGVVYDPTHGELFHAVRGGGSYLNNRPIQVSNYTTLAQSMMVHDWSRSDDARQSVISLLACFGNEVRNLRCFGSAALALAWIACGRIEGYFNYRLGIWDVGGGSLILQESGGTISGFDGKQFDITDPQSWQLSTNGKIHSALLALLESDKL